MEAGAPFCPASVVLKSVIGAGVLKIVDDYDGDTYRGVYTVRFAGRVYVLYAFQKKWHRGAQTDRRDRELIEVRLRMAEEHCSALQEKKP